MNASEVIGLRLKERQEIIVKLQVVACNSATGKWTTDDFGNVCVVAYDGDIKSQHVWLKPEQIMAICVGDEE
jgi:hypothetical protein